MRSMILISEICGQTFPLKAFNSAGFEYGDKIRAVVCHEGEKVFDEKVLFHKSFGFVEKGQPMIYNNELMESGYGSNSG